MDKLSSGLVEFNTYSKGTMFMIGAFALIAPVINFFFLYWHRNAAWVSIELIIFAYALPLIIMAKLIDSLFLPRVMPEFVSSDRNTKIIGALVHGLIGGAVIGGILILWSYFLPWGPKTIFLYVPWYNSEMDWFAWTMFVIFWVILLPLAETMFYCLLQMAVFTSEMGHLFIALMYALMNFCWLIYVVQGWWSIIILTAISFAIGLALIHAKKDNFFKALGHRWAISIGIFALIIFLNLRYPRVKSPTFYYRGSSYRGGW
jgi:hypothetical protein